MKRGFIRIIGGKWRSRRLNVPDIVGLRPTPDRVRETLFNWLALDIIGARCLDAFAGTGALGFEAASRGADAVTLVESSSVALKELTKSLESLSAENVNIIKGRQPDILKNLKKPFDIVFLDPPWDKINLLKEVFLKLTQKNILKKNTKIYVEAPRPLNEFFIFDGWKISKQINVGDVYAGIIERNKND